MMRIANWPRAKRPSQTTHSVSHRCAAPYSHRQRLSDKRPGRGHSGFARAENLISSEATMNQQQNDPVIDEIRELRHGLTGS